MKSRLCSILNIEYPIIQAGMGSFTSAEMVAAVSNAGGLGSMGTGFRTGDGLRRELNRIRELTHRPFAVNYVMANMDEEIFGIILEAKPPVISFALGYPGDLIQQAHEAGSLVMHMVNTVRQARAAADGGVDILVAQGSESGGFSGTNSTLVLVPQIVEAVAPKPVVAAGGIADAQGLAAVMALGALGANIGTRFLASVEAPIDDHWKQAILSAESEDAIKVEFWDDIFPKNPLMYEITSRAIRTPFIEKWQYHRDSVRQNSDTLRNELISAMRENHMEKYVPWAGQSCGLIHDILPAGEIVRMIGSGISGAI